MTRPEVITRSRHIFSRGETDIGHVTTVKHRLEMTDHTPFKQRHKRIPQSMFKEVRDHLQQLLTAGIIRKSKLPFSSNVVFVRKKIGDLRMCVDYRQLINKTKKDAYVLQPTEEILDSLSGNSYFTVLVTIRSRSRRATRKKQHSLLIPWVFFNTIGCLLAYPTVQLLTRD